MEQFHNQSRPTLARRYDNSNSVGNARPDHRVKNDFKGGKPAPKKPQSRNLDPHERRLAAARRNELTVRIERSSIEGEIVGKVVEFGKFDIVIRRADGVEVCLFKSDLSTLIVEGYISGYNQQVQ